MYQVIIVEDDPMVAEIDKQYVEHNSKMAIAGIFQNGQDALDFVRTHPVDLIMLDYYMPVMDGRIEGAAPDKVFFLVAPDDSMRGFRILRDDLCLIVPSGSPIDGAVMLVEHNQHRYLRKVKKLDALNVLLQSYDREYAAETCALPDVNFLGRVVKVEFSI